MNPMLPLRCKKAFLLALAFLCLGLNTGARATTWINAAGGSWQTGSNWGGGSVPGGVGATADFSTLNLTADATVTLASSVTVGTLLFGDTTPSKNWIVSGSPITLAASGSNLPVLTVTNQQVTFNAPLFGSQGLIKNGAGVAYLAGGLSNNVTGPLSVNAGALGTSSGASMKYITGAVTVAPGASFNAQQAFDGNSFSNNFFISGIGYGSNGWGALNLEQNVTLTGSITLNADSAISHDWNSATINGPIVGVNTNLKLATLQAGQYGITIGGDIQLGTGALTLSGTGTAGSPDFTLSGSNSFSGATLSAGVTAFGAVNALGSGTFTFGGSATLRAAVGGVLGTPLAIGPGLTGTFDTQSNAVTLSGALSGSGALTKIGAGTLTLSGGTSNNLTGAILVASGALGASAGASMKNLAGAVTVAAGASFNAAQNFDSNNFANRFFISGTGCGSNGWGALNLQQNVTTTGTITLNADATLSHDWNVATINGPIVGTNMNLKLTTLQTSQYGFTINGSVQLGTGTLTLTGTGTVASPDCTLTASNSFSAAVVNSGVLYFQTDTAMGGTGANITVYGDGVTARNGSTMTKLLTRTGTNSTGAIAFNASSSSTALDFTNYPGLSLGTISTTTYTGVLTPGGGNYRLGGGSGTLTMNTSLSGTNGLIVHGAQGGTVVLAAAHSFTGPTAINAGTLRVSGTLSGAVSVSAGGCLAPGPATGIGSLTLTQPVTLSGSLTLRINRNSAQTADLLTAPSLTLGGVLTVLNSGSAPQLGDTFRLFAVSGTTVIVQPAVNLPTLTAGLTWDLSSLGTNGTIKAVASSNQVGDPNWPGLLPYQIQSAYNAGYSSVTINSGTYTMPDGGGANFSYSALANFTIDATSALFIVGTQDAFDFINCTNVTLKGATIRPRTYPLTQGLVVAEGLTSGTIPYADWRVSDGYPTSFQWWFNAVSGSSRTISVETGDLYYTQSNATYLGNNTWRLSFPGFTQLSFQVNDWLVARSTQSQGFAVYLNGCQNCTLQSVTSQSGGFATFRENGGGGNQMLACRIQPSPTAPVGGTETPVVACAADGVHTTWTYPGMHLENCVFTGVFLDDNIAIHGSFQTVLSVLSGSDVVFNGAGAFAVGDPVRFSNTGGFFAQANCTAIQDLGSSQYQVTLDQALPVPVGAKASNPKYNGSGFQIINCQLGGTRSRAIITKADNGLISGCTIANAGTAMQIGPEYYWNESDYSWNVTVTANTITHCGSGIVVVTDGALGNEAITITNNILGPMVNGSEMDIEGCVGATISGNTFTAPGPQPALWFQDCTNVGLSGTLVPYTSGSGTMLGLGTSGCLDPASSVNLSTGVTLNLAFSGTDTINQLSIDGIAQSPGVWGGLASNAAYKTAIITGSGCFYVATGPGQQPYTSWTASYGLTSTVAAFSADPDNDGLSNGLEWILGGNPLTNNAALPKAAVAASQMQLRFSRNPSSLASTTLTVQWSTNLQSWHDVPVGAGSSGPDTNGATVTVTTNASAPDGIVVAVPLSNATAGKLFMRLKATQP